MLVIALSALLPGILCAVLLVALRAWREDASTRLVWAVPLAVAVGFIVAQTVVDGAPRIPPIEASGWFSIVTAVLAVLAIAVRPRVTPMVWALVSTLATLAMVLTIVHPLFGGAWTTGTGIAWVVGLTAVAATVAYLVDRRGSPGPGGPAVFLIAATGVALVLTICGSARYGQLAGAIASVMGPLVLLGLLRRDFKIVSGGAWVSYLVLAMLIVAGVTYVDVPVFIGLLVAASPLGMLAGELPFLASGSSWKRDGVRVAVTLALVGAAVGLAVAAATSPDGY